MQKRYVNWPLWEKIFFPAYFTVIAVMGIFSKSSWLALIASLLVFTGCMLNTKARTDAYAYNAIGTFLYGIVALQSKNYGEMVLAFAYNVPCYIYALLRWRKSDTNTKEVYSVLHLSRRQALVIAGLFLAGSTIYWLILRSVGSAYPLLNSIATCSCIVAILLASNRAYEQWLFWNIYNIVYILIWFPRGNFDTLPLAITGVGFTITATKAWVQWHMLEKKQN